MESQNFSQAVLKDINLIRQTPNALNKNFDKVKLTMSRFKGQEATVKDIEQFTKSLNSAKGVGTLNLNWDLCKVAEKVIEYFEETGNFTTTFDSNFLQSKAEVYVEGYNQIHLIVDQGAEESENLIGRVLFNKNDKERKNRKIIFDDNLKQVGIAYKILGDENTVAIIFVDKCSGKNGDKGDITELKQAFDMFDVNGIGKINAKETLNAMRSLGYEYKNPTLFNIMKELDTPENEIGVDFDTFVDHFIKIENNQNEEELRKIFSLFLENATEDTITLATLKKICVELGETVSVDELKDLISRAVGSGNELNFQEFSDFMKKKYGNSEIKA